MNFKKDLIIYGSCLAVFADAVFIPKYITGGLTLHEIVGQHIGFSQHTENTREIVKLIEISSIILPLAYLFGKNLNTGSNYWRDRIKK